MGGVRFLFFVSCWRIRRSGKSITPRPTHYQKTILCKLYSLPISKQTHSTCCDLQLHICWGPDPGSQDHNPATVAETRATYTRFGGHGVAGADRFNKAAVVQLCCMVHTKRCDSCSLCWERQKDIIWNWYTSHKHSQGTLSQTGFLCIYYIYNSGRSFKKDEGYFIYPVHVVFCKGTLVLQTFQT